MTADVLPIRVQICERFALQSSSVICAVFDMFHEEHLSFTDSRAMFKDSVTENHPGALNLNLSTFQSHSRILHPPLSLSQDPMQVTRE